MRLLFALSMVTSTAHAAVLQVGPGQPYTTITAAVAAARSGDVIAIGSGTYDEAVEVQNLDLAFTAAGNVEWTATDDNVLAIYDSEISITGIVFHPDGGRGVRSSNCVVSIADSEFSGNNNGPDSYNGAAIAVYDGSAVTVSNTRFFDNASTTSFFGGGNGGNGGAIYVVDGDLTVDGSTFAENEADYGGAIHHAGTGTTIVRDCTFSGNNAGQRAGAIFLTDDATLTVERASFQDNTTNGNGGAFRWEDGTASATFHDCTFLRNEADGYGGAIAVNAVGDLEITGSAFLENGSQSGGGGVSLASADGLTLARSVFCNNTSADEGGGLRLNSVDTSAISNNVFVNNESGDWGGGIVILNGTHTLWNNDLLDSSAAAPGGAIHADGGAVLIRNNLIAWTTSNAGVDGNARFDIDYNAWYQNTPGNTGRGINQGARAVTADPLLVDYTRNGACDDDVSLLAGSPLIDAGDPSRTDLDGSRSDIGAFGGPDAPASTVLDGDNDGTVDAYDCAPTDPNVHPGAAELCNGLDDDCDGQADAPAPAGAPTWYGDRDRDGFGDDATSTAACTAPRGFVDVGGDCDDRDRDLNPGADELCDGVDNDCDGIIDADATQPPVWYPDADGDGFGDATAGVGACEAPPGSVALGGDCDDASADISPAKDERCNDIDDNCDGVIDGVDAVDQLPWYADLDGDNWGVPGAGTVMSCDQPDGAFARSDEDCDDTNPAIHPQAPEDCDDPADMNCDGSSGQDDLDADGFVACEDCDDRDANVRPGAPDVWYDGVIQDCGRASDFDQDGDGYESDAYGGDDCADLDGAVNPAASESFTDEIDNDCDGVIATDPYIDEVLKAGCGGCSGAGRPASGSALVFAAALITLRRAPRSRR